ncbi:hypothetical protein HN011_001350 [Eciton burchellii]|nr:hypothetical protein HN011_001350 [Eciton burchellii]
MASSKKKSKIVRDSSDFDESCMTIGNDDKDLLQVEFEGFNPNESDYDGIKILLHQLFLKAHIDLGNLTDIIISQKHVGSVVKQVVSDDDIDADNQIFGVTTVINITSKQKVPCINQIRNLLKQLANKHATDSTNAMIKNLLENDAARLGLIINERFINLSAKISLPLIENLIFDIELANDNKMPFNFSHYLLICKLHKSKDKAVKEMLESKNENADEESVIWSNAEEEIFAEEAIASFEFCVDEEADNALYGKWTETDCEMIPYRRVLLLEASKLQIIFNKIQSNFL